MSGPALVARGAERLGDRGWVLYPPAKLNLYLEVLGRRADGYHEIVTVLEPIDLTDRLVVEKTGEPLSFTCTDAALPVDGGNLVVRAAEAYFGRFGEPARGRLHLEKRIPWGAGLGGGSSDAAAVLWALDRLDGHRLGGEALRELAVELGSDVVFFLGTGRAIGTGRGEILRPIPAREAADYVLLYPRLRLSTADVYGSLRSSLIWKYDGNRIDSLQTRRYGSKTFEQEVRNDLERAACLVSRSLAETWQWCDALEIGSFHLTGSGSTLFTRQASRAAARRAATELSRRDLGDVFVVRNLF